MNDDKTEFNFKYDRTDGTNINYHILYDSKNKIVNQLCRYKNQEKDIFFLKENYKNSSDSDKIVLGEFIKMLGDINLNTEDINLNTKRN